MKTIPQTNNTTANIRYNNRGALLMNLLVSVAILAGLTASAIPLFSRYQPSLKLSASVRDLTSDLRYAQQKTVSTQIAHGIYLDASNDKYELVTFNPATTTIKSVVFPSEVSYQSITGFSGNLVLFNAYGAVAEDGTITLVNISGKTKFIDIKPSGYVELQQ